MDAHEAVAPSARGDDPPTPIILRSRAVRLPSAVDDQPGEADMDPSAPEPLYSVGIAAWARDVGTTEDKEGPFGDEYLYSPMNGNKAVSNVCMRVKQYRHTQGVVRLLPTLRPRLRSFVIKLV